jgi:hypothetical protein
VRPLPGPHYAGWLSIRDQRAINFLIYWRST